MNDHHKKEIFYKKAKTEGYRARSAYKLINIQQKFNIFKRAFYILDIGCAPGSWLQVAKKFAEENLEKYNDQYYHRSYFKIMGIDIKKTSPIEDVYTLLADITNPETQKEINQFFQDKLDLIISDASIKKSGNKFIDQLKQLDLCYEIMNIAKENLKFKGNLVMKAFQGSDFIKFTKEAKKLFKILRSFKPESSKKTSNEIFIIGLQKKD